MKHAPDITANPTPWREIVLVCGKCSKKLDGGFGHKHRDSLRKLLREGLREAGRRREVRIIETGCLGLCPKNAVTVMLGSAPGAMLAVGEGAPVDEVLARVLPG